MNGLGPNFWEIVVPIRARETALACEELHDLLVGHESYLHRLEVATQQHVLTICPQRWKISQAVTLQNDRDDHTIIGLNATPVQVVTQMAINARQMAHDLTHLAGLVIITKNILLTANYASRWATLQKVIPITIR